MLKEIDMPPADAAIAPAATARDALGRVPWLDAVPAATLDALAQHAVLHRMPPDSQLFEQAEIPTFALLLLSGSVELLGVRGKEETLVEFVRGPDLILPAAVLNQQPYLMRARVLGEAWLVMVQASTFRDAVAADHALALAVLSCQAAQFRRQIKHAKNLQLRSAEERIGCYLMGLLAAVPPGEPVRLPLEKRLIASQLGMTRETFSRTLSAVARRGIRVDGDMVMLEDAAAAQAHFALDPLLDGPEAIIPLPRKET
ncbi:MAG: helix-turn-helix domain-containing protein [Acetobacteraceae bacterium]|nr:helix-turn-helix domain-containing protein [Pseudomonadota bacterium]